MRTSHAAALGLGLAGLAVFGAQVLLRRSRWFGYAGRRVLVTGGARGLGLVIARQLVAAGAKVAICSRSPKELALAAAELRGEGGDVLTFDCDVTQRDEVDEMVRQIIEHWGAVDIVFNVAGVIEVGPVDTMTLDDFQQSMNTHCWGALHTTLAALPTMRRAGWGRVVNIASLGGKRAVPHMLPYAASKFALVGLSTGLRAELAADGVLVTTVCPGLMRTGSPRNATFKGQHRKEYAWFSIGDSLPLVSMSADSAARRILKACQRGDAECVMPLSASLAVKAQSLAPNLAAEVMAIFARMLPETGGVLTHPAKGHESESWLSSSILTALSRRAARKNNEMTSTR